MGGLVLAILYGRFCKGELFGGEPKGQAQGTSCGGELRGGLP